MQSDTKRSSEQKDSVSKGQLEQQAKALDKAADEAAKLVEDDVRINISDPKKP